MPKPDEELLDKARKRTVRETDVKECWSWIVRGIELGWLDHAELKSVLEYLRQQRDYGVEELLFAWSGDRVRVSFLDESSLCSPHALIEELAGLLEHGTR